MKRMKYKIFTSFCVSLLLLILVGCPKTVEEPDGSIEETPTGYSIIYVGNGNTAGTIPVDSNDYLVL